MDRRPYSYIAALLRALPAFGKIKINTTLRRLERRSVAQDYFRELASIRADFTLHVTNILKIQKNENQNENQNEKKGTKNQTKINYSWDFKSQVLLYKVIRSLKAWVDKENSYRAELNKTDTDVLGFHADEYVDPTKEKLNLLKELLTLWNDDDQIENVNEKILKTQQANGKKLHKEELKLQKKKENEQSDGTDGSNSGSSNLNSSTGVSSSNHSSSSSSSCSSSSSGGMGSKKGRKEKAQKAARDDNALKQRIKVFIEKEGPANPKTSYSYFTMEKRQSNTHISDTSINDEWKKLEEEEDRKKWENMANQDRHRYSTEYATFKTTVLDQEIIRLGTEHQLNLATEAAAKVAAKAEADNEKKLQATKHSKSSNSKSNSKKEPLTAEETEKIKQIKKYKKLNGPKGPRNSYMCYSVPRRSTLMTERPELAGNVGVISKILGEEWRKMSDDDKKIYQDLAVQDKIRYEKEDVIFQPILQKWIDEGMVVVKASRKRNGKSGGDGKNGSDGKNGENENDSDGKKVMQGNTWSEIVFDEKDFDKK